MSRYGNDNEQFKSAKDYVDRESVDINNLVNAIVNRYSNELDEFVSLVKEYLQMIKEGSMDVYETETLELQAIKLPTLLYFAGDGLEALGADSDIAEYRKKELYNQVIEEMSTEKYTIPDKKAAAEKRTEYEAMVKEVYDRSYKKLKLKIEHACKLLESMKKVIEIRIAKINKGRGGDEQNVNRGH